MWNIEIKSSTSLQMHREPSGFVETSAQLLSIWVGYLDTNYPVSAGLGIKNL